MTTPFDKSAAVLDAAGRGATVSGYEAVGGLLLELAVTVPVAPASALASSGVAAACAATAPGRLATLAGFVRPRMIVGSLAASALVAALVLSPGGTAARTPGPAGTGVSRVATSSGQSLDPSGADATTDVTLEPGSAAPIAGSDRSGRLRESADQQDSTESEPGDNPATLPSTTGPQGSGPSSSVPTTSTSPTTTSGPTVTVPSTTDPTTTIPTTTTREPHGNNGNGNGNGVGNGKGNQGDPKKPEPGTSG